MFIFRKYTKLFFSILLILLAGDLCAEQFRVAKVHVVQITDDVDSEASATLGLNDALAVFMPENRPFIKGLEIKMSIPEETALWRDCCACCVYDSVNPLPLSGQIDFSGSRIFFEVLPGKLSWYLQIPFSNTERFKTNQYTTRIEKTPDLSCNFVFLRLQQVMKGVPDSVLESVITMSIKPILSDEGILNLSITEPPSPSVPADTVADTTEAAVDRENDDEEASEDKLFYTVFVDDKPVPDDEKEIILKTGIHNISVISENYRTEVRTARIEQAKKTELEILLKSIEPSIIVTAPEGTAILVDEEPFTELGKEVTVSEGEHKIRFTIGDYEIIRSISVIKGKTYKVNLTVDLQISEE